MLSVGLWVPSPALEEKERICVNHILVSKTEYLDFFAFNRLSCSGTPLSLALRASLRLFGGNIIFPYFTTLPMINIVLTLR